MRYYDNPVTWYAFEDELQKIAYAMSVEKDAQVMQKIVGGVKGLAGKAKSMVSKPPAWEQIAKAPGVAAEGAQQALPTAFKTIKRTGQRGVGQRAIQAARQQASQVRGGLY